MGEGQVFETAGSGPAVGISGEPGTWSLELGAASGQTSAGSERSPHRTQRELGAGMPVFPARRLPHQAGEDDLAGGDACVLVGQRARTPRDNGVAERIAEEQHAEIQFCGAAGNGGVGPAPCAAGRACGEAAECSAKVCRRVEDFRSARGRDRGGGGWCDCVLRFWPGRGQSRRG